MAGALAAQLDQLAAGKEERVRGRASLLYDPQQAADVDLQTIYAAAVKGFAELCRIDGRFEAFSKTLFSKSGAELNRDAQDDQANARLDASIAAYFRLLSTYFLLPAAARTLEFLIRRYKVHVYNVEDALLCSLPYHATPQFVRWLQVLQLDGTRWAFLSDVRAQGATPTREALTVVLSRDNAMLTTLCDAALASASGTIKGTSGVAAAFYALMCSEAIGRMTRVPASVMPPILAYVQAGLGSGASAEHRAGALLLSAQLATRAQLSPAVVEALLDGMAKIAQPPLEASALKCMLQLMRTHAIAVLSRRAVTFLVKTPALSAVLGQLSSTTKVDALLGPLLAGLVALLGQHHTYANAICSLVSDVRMRPHAAVVTRQLLQLISDGREVNMETRARVMTVLQVLQKHYPEEMRSVLDFELLAVHGATDNPITTIIRDAFGSTAVQPLSVSDVAITLSSGLEHTNPRLREAAVKQLRELLATNTDAVSHLANVIKCRAADSDPAVAAATLALPGLIDLIADDAALHAAVTATLASCTAALRSGSGSHAHENAASRALSVLLQLGERRPSFAGSVARALLDLLVDDEAVKGLAATARRVACTVNHPVFANDDACSSNDLLTQQHAALRSVGRRLAADDRACNWVTSDWSSLTSYGQHTVLLALLCALTDAGVDSRSRPALVAWRILRHVPAESDGLDSILCWHDGLPPATHLQTHATAAAAAEASVSVIQQLWPQIARHLPADMADSSSPDVGSLGQLFGRLCRYPDGKAMTALLERASAVFGSTHMFLALLAAADPGHLDDTVQVAALGKLADHQWPAEVAPLIMVALMHPRRRVRQAAVDALAARNRHSGADISPQLTSWVQSHREALTTGGASLQLLQGALKDGAFAGMTPHILSSLVSLQSKYAMTQLARLLVADMNSGTATAFASVWARIAVSCGSDADVALSQILLDGIAGVAGVDQSSREVLVHALESISLRPALHTAALNAVSETLYASCLETEQRRILQATISLSRRSSQSECSAAARSLLNRISFDATAVGELLGSLLGFGRQASVQPTPAKRTRGRAATAATGTGQNILVAGAMSSAVDMDLLEAVLEMLQWRSVARVEMLATPLFRVLAALLDAPIDVPQSLEARVDTDGDDSPAEDAASALSAAHGYRLTLTLSTLTNVVRAATDCAVDVQLIVRALQQASDANVRKAALQLLTAAAESMPSQVVNDALIVVQSLTSVEFVSVDDAQTARALHDAFAAIAPCWVQAHSDNGAQLLRLVVDTLHAVPRHRHAALLSALLHALPAPHALAETLWMLLAVNDRGEQSVGSTLCSSRPRVECLRAWHAMLTRANVQSNVAPTVVTVADFICNELKMTGLQSWFAHHADDVDVRSSYAEFIAAVLTKLELVKKNPSVDGVDGRKSMDAVLAALQTLAAGPMQYVLALTHLFTHEDRHVQRKALLQASRCIRGSAEEVAPDEAKEAAALHGLLLPLVLGGDSTHTAAQLGALEFLEALIVRYGVHEQFAESAVAALQTAVLCAKRESRLSIRAAALSCVASSVAALGTRVVPALPEVMSTVLDVLESTDTTTPDGIKVSSAALAVIAGLVLKLENFISPVLARVQRLLLSQLLCGTDVPAELRQAAGDIRTSLAARVPVRLLLEPLLASWDTALASGWEACVAVLRQVKLLVERLDSVQTAAYCETLFAFELLCMDTRRVRLNEMQGDENIHAVETGAVDACVALVIKLSEVRFMPLFMTSLEWSRASPEHFARPRVFFRMASALSEALRSVFVPFYKHLLPDAVDYLTSGKVQSSVKKARRDASTIAGARDGVALWRLRVEVVSALRLCFLHDTSGFVDEARFNKLLPALLLQLDESPPADVDDAEIRAADDVLLGCLVQLAVSVGQDALWRALNRGVLMATRQASVRPRRLGVAVVAALVDRLAEEYLVLLPETMPFLAELVEDTDELVEASARQLLAKLSQLADEDLADLLG